MTNIDTSNFRNPQGVYRTKGLFFETAVLEKHAVVYTLKPEDHLGFPSLKLKYIELEDPTEYEFANIYLAGWEHWTKLLECDWFIPYITQWRLELELKLKAKAYRKIIGEATTPGRNTFNANKYILESFKKFTGGQEESHGRGRPSKEEIASAAFQIASSGIEIDEDSKRIRLVK